MAATGGAAGIGGAAGQSGAGGTATGGAAGAAGGARTSGMGGASGAAGEGGGQGASGSGGTTGGAGSEDKGGSAGTGGTPVDASVVDASCPEAGDAPDDVTVPSCGQPGAPSRRAYNGIVIVTLSGIIQGAPGVSQDPFYALNANDFTKTTGPCPECLVYNHFAEGSCVCPSECPTTSHRVANILVGGYPAFNPLHSYTVTLDLGSAAPDRINFAYGDCGCYDNAGSYSLTIACGH